MSVTSRLPLPQTVPAAAFVELVIDDFPQLLLKSSTHENSAYSCHRLRVGYGGYKKIGSHL